MGRRWFSTLLSFAFLGSLWAQEPKGSNVSGGPVAPAGKATPATNVPSPRPISPVPTRPEAVRKPLAPVVPDRKTVFTPLMVIGGSSALVGALGLASTFLWIDAIQNSPKGSYSAYVAFDPTDPVKLASYQKDFPGFSTRQVAAKLYTNYSSELDAANVTRISSVALLGGGLALYVVGILLRPRLDGFAVIPFGDGFAAVAMKRF